RLGPAIVERAILRWHVEGAVRRVSAQEAEEGRLGIRCNEGKRLFEEDVGAIALELRGHAIREIGVVEIVIAPPVGCLAETSTAVDDACLKSAILWAIGIAIAEVPFAEDAGAPTRFAQRVRKRPF